MSRRYRRRKRRFPVLPAIVGILLVRRRLLRSMATLQYRTINAPISDRATIDRAHDAAIIDRPIREHPIRCLQVSEFIESVSNCEGRRTSELTGRRPAMLTSDSPLNRRAGSAICSSNPLKFQGLNPMVQLAVRGATPNRKTVWPPIFALRTAIASPCEFLTPTRSGGQDAGGVTSIVRN
jgi:hypothetical protein